MAKSTLLGILVLWFVLVFQGAATGAEELRGVYVELHNNKQFGAFPLVPDRDWRGLCARLKKLGVNAIFPLAVSPSGAVYPSNVVQRKSAGWRQNYPDLLKVLTDAAHREGLEIHAWVILWNQAPKETDADRLVHDAEGKTQNTLCPSNKNNRTLMARMIMELVRGYNLDGIHYDYMRLPGNNFCYCDNCKVGFQRRMGVHITNWPADVRPGGKYESQYVEYLCGLLSSFVKQMYGSIKEARPNLVVSAAVWPNRRSAGNLGVRQDWGEWVKKGWLDFLAPMNYGSTWVVDRFGEFARNEAKHVVGKMPLVYSLGAFQDSPEGQVKAVRLGRKLKCSGFIVYTLTEKTFNQHLPRLHTEVWSDQAKVPGFGRNKRHGSSRAKIVPH